jgi:hypothetical protein
MSAKVFRDFGSTCVTLSEDGGPLKSSWSVLSCGGEARERLRFNGSLACAGLVSAQVSLIKVRVSESLGGKPEVLRSIRALPVLSHSRSRWRDFRFQQSRC